MGIREAFTASIYLLVLTGLVALAYAEGNSVFLVLTIGGAIAAYLRAERAARPMGRTGTNLAVLGCLFAAPADFVFITGDGPLTVAHLLGAVQVVKLFGEKQPRDHMQIIVISLIHLGLAAVLTIDLAFSILFLVYMAVAVWTLLLFLVYREVGGEPDGEQLLRSVRVGRGAFGAFTAVTLATLAITAVLFVLFPRFSAVLFQVPRKQQAAVSGFSDRIGLADLSSVKLRDDDVMRVTIDARGDALPAQPLWRGLVYDLYDPATKEWKRDFRPGVPGRLPIHRDPVVQGANRSWGFDRERLRRESASSYTVLLGPTGTSAIFAVPDVAEVTFVSGAAAPTSVALDQAGAVEGHNMPDTDSRYQVRSVRPGAPTESADERSHWYVRQAPQRRDPVSQALGAYAQTVVEEKGVAEATYAAQVEALLDHLREGPFAYSLDDLRAPRDEDPVVYFVTRSRRGHCELFASAFVLMARTLGIPARLVSGFQSGEWNDLGHYYRVRQRDAHAWAEVFLDGRWVTVDPTPAADEAPGGMFAQLEQVIDYLKHRWMNYVISYSLSDQISAAERVRTRLFGLKRFVTRIGEWLRERIERLDLRSMAVLLGALSAMAALGGLAVLALRWLVRRGANGRAAPRSAARVDFYEDLVAALARIGFARAPTETPREWGQRIAGAAAAVRPRTVVGTAAGPGADGGPRPGGEGGEGGARGGAPAPEPLEVRAASALERVPRVVDAFYDVRFGGQALGAERHAEIREVLADLAEAARARRLARAIAGIAASVAGVGAVEREPAAGRGASGRGRGASGRARTGSTSAGGSESGRGGSDEQRKVRQ